MTMPLRDRARKAVVSAAVKGSLGAMSRAGRAHPAARRLRRGVDVVRDIPYRDGGDPAHTLDIYQPSGATGPLPVMLYVHGGGFVILSKDSHWMFGYGLANRGWLVFSINYRLAPANPFPLPLIDCADALAWVLAHAGDYGGDLCRLAYAGESAGANLAATLAIMGAWPRPEPFAQRIYDLDPSPKVVSAACGILQVTQPERYLEQERLPVWLRDRIAKVCRSYLPSDGGDPELHALSSPLTFLESAAQPKRRLPAVFAPCGTRDPIAEDTRRLGKALARLGAAYEAPFYYGGVHAFHAVFWSELAQQCWDDQDAFFAQHILR